MGKNYYPLSLDIEDKLCIVIGGGKVAERKIFSLLECGAKIEVISPAVTEPIASLHSKAKLTWLREEYNSEDITAAFLVIAATSSKFTNLEIAKDCKKQKILVNVVDNLGECDFIVPATLRKEDITISISTSGKSPALAKHLKQEIDVFLSNDYIELVELIGKARAKAKQTIEDQKLREKVLSEMDYSDLLLLIKKGKAQEIKERIEKCILSL